MYNFLMIVWTTDYSKRTIIAFATSSTFQVQLPAGDDQTSSLHLSVRIRDTLECITQLNISTVRVVSDSASITDLVNNLQCSSLSALANNSIVQLLASGNQNAIGQVISSISQHFNQKNTQSLDNAVSRMSDFNDCFQKKVKNLFFRWCSSC